MGAFVDRVRNSKVPHPTQRSFSVESWRKNYRQTPDPDDSDTNLLEAGLFFYDIFCSLREKLKESRFNRVRRRDRLIAIGAFLNHEVAALMRKTRAQPVPPAGSTIPGPDLIQTMVTLRTGIRVTPDQLLTTLLDSMVYPLDEALGARDDGEPLSSNFDAEIGFPFAIASMYRIASDLWHDCLWRGHIIDRLSSRERIVIRPPLPEFAQQEAVSEHRHQTHFIATGNYSFRIWRHDLPMVVKRALVIDRGVISYHPERRNRFTVEKLNLHRRQNMPQMALRWAMAYDEYLQSFVHLRLPDTNGFTIDILRQIWEVLGTLVDAVLRYIPDSPSGNDWFLAHAVRVSRRELENVLASSLRFELGILSSAVDFFTYQTRTDGLWQKPLVRLDDAEFLLVAGPLRHGNMLRTAERWLRQGGFGLERRGPVFESLARQTIATYLRESPKLHDVYVEPDPIFVGSENEEVDLLVRIGGVLLVGEAKCQLFPVDSVETYRFQERLKEAAAQAKRKARAVEKAVTELPSTIGINGRESVVVRPFVLSNILLGSGYPVDDVPVVDLLFLGALLREGYFRTMVVMSAKEDESGNIVHYYKDQADAERRIPELLERQPAIKNIESLVKKRIRPMPIDPKDTHVYEEYYAVSLDANPFDFQPTVG